MPFDPIYCLNKKKVKFINYVIAGFYIMQNIMAVVGGGVGGWMADGKEIWQMKEPGKEGEKGENLIKTR